MWIVNIVETDEFGWTALLHESREFKFEEDAKAFAKTYNSKLHMANPSAFLIARDPQEQKPIENTSAYDKPNEPEEDQVQYAPPEEIREKRIKGRPLSPN